MIKTTDICGQKISDKKFEDTRKEVLSLWPTGKEVDLPRAIEHQKSIAKEKRITYKLVKSRKEGKILTEPRGGVSDLEEHIALLTYLQDEGGADILPTTIDSYTRNARYAEAQISLDEGLKTGKSTLAGLPAVNYGVRKCKEVVESLKVPVEARTCAALSRLLAEVLLASGFTGMEGGGITCNIPYAKNLSLERTIAEWLYVARLIGFYEENGISIFREQYGALTGVLVPPSISHAVAIIECLTEVEQGVKNFGLGIVQGGSIIQDIAAIRTLPKLAEEYLQLAGHKDISIFTIFHQYMGPFPPDKAQAFAVICYSSVAAALGGVDIVISKSPYEAIGMPTKESNAAGARATKQILRMLRNQRFPASDELYGEMEMITKETRLILNRVFDLGHGDAAIGAIRAFEAGVIDVPFSPSIYNAGKVLTIKDKNGAIRFLDHGNLPFTKDIVKFHKEKVLERAAAEHRKPDYKMLIEDVLEISRDIQEN